MTPLKKSLSLSNYDEHQGSGSKGKIKSKMGGVRKPPIA